MRWPYLKGYIAMIAYLLTTKLNGDSQWVECVSPEVFPMQSLLKQTRDSAYTDFDSAYFSRFVMMRGNFLRMCIDSHNASLLQSECNRYPPGLPHVNNNAMKLIFTQSRELVIQQVL